MDSYPLDEAAQRSGISSAFLAHLTDLAIVTPDENGRYSDDLVRRAQVMATIDRAGLPLDGVATLLDRGLISLDFIDAAGYTVFAPRSDVTFEALSNQSGVPTDLLMSLREVVGGGRPATTDRVRLDELAISPLIELQWSLGFRPEAIEQALRVYGDSLRRIAETEAEWWRNEVQTPMFARGMTESDISQFAAELSPRLSEVSDQAIVAAYHAQQMLAWTTNIVNGFASALERAGLHSRDVREPAMCFLDVTGYTQYSADHGDSAAANLAERMRRISERAAVRHDGRAVKWLGDGVMFFFPDPAAGVIAALDMRDGIKEAGLPPSHVGLHAGAVVFQEGDYYGQTVNLAARIGEFARPGEVLVSEQVVAYVAADSVAFREIGPVMLKGVGDSVRLYSAEHRRADQS